MSRQDAHLQLPARSIHSRMRATNLFMVWAERTLRLVGKCWERPRARDLHACPSAQHSVGLAWASR